MGQERVVSEYSGGLRSNARRLVPAARDEHAGARVLIAEDEVIIAMMLEDVLSDEGFQVTVTHDGVEALEAAQEQPFDILVTDLRMPRLDGAGLIRRIREIHPTLPVVILTSHATMDCLSWGEAGPTVLLEKPLALPSLAERIRDLLPATSP